MPQTQPTAGFTKPYRDVTGKTLADYPQPSVAVDTAVLTLAPRTKSTRGAPPYQLSVLLVRLPEPIDGAEWGLPGTFMHGGERLAGAVARSLAEKGGVTGARTAQLGVFDDPDRDPRGWVLSVAHLAVIPFAALEDVVLADPERVRLAPVSRPGPLPYDHPDIVLSAKIELRRRYADRPDPERLLGPRFTSRQLLDIHQAIAGPTLQKDTFRRAMEPFLEATGTWSSCTVGRPSQLYRRARKSTSSANRLS